MTELPSYTLAEHRHRFAAWAAARAAQRGLAEGNVGCFIDALTKSGFCDAALKRQGLPATAPDFDVWHRELTRRVFQRLLKTCSTATYGRAAKAIAIYLKSAVVLGPRPPEPFTSLVHPPIDDLLLSRVRADEKVDEEVRKACRVKWTKLGEPEYSQLIQVLRTHGLDKPAFWMLERYWPTTANATSRAGRKTTRPTK